MVIEHGQITASQVPPLFEDMISGRCFPWFGPIVELKLIATGPGVFEVELRTLSNWCQRLRVVKD